VVAFHIVDIQTSPIFFLIWQNIMRGVEHCIICNLTLSFLHIPNRYHQEKQFISKIIHLRKRDD